MGGHRPIKLSFSAAFQAKYCLVMVGVLLSASFILYFYLNQNLSGSYLESLRTLQRLEQKLPYYLLITALLQTLFVLILTLIINLVVSHQIAGPVFRYEDVLTRISEGNLPSRISTRKGDQLKPMVDALNEFNDSLRTVYCSAQTLHDMVDPSLVQPQSAHSADWVSLQRQIAKVRKEMGDFSRGPGEVD